MDAWIKPTDKTKVILGGQFSVHDIGLNAAKHGTQAMAQAFSKG